MDTIEVNGLTFAVRIEHDDCMGAPWTEHDGHGIVSEWTSRSKAPGEKVLASDRTSKRYYDIQATIELAIKDGWGASGNTEGMTKRQIAALAVEQDFEHLQAWCNDDWRWVYVMVTLLDVERNATNERESLGGVESSDSEYLKSTAIELATEIANRIGDSDSLCVKVRNSEVTL
jgi:hypothetical protein